MSVSFGFYNSLNSDRMYDALQISRLLDGVVNDGIFESVGTAFAPVAPGGGMTVNIGAGRAWFNHTWTFNDDVLAMIIEEAEVALNRIDTIIIEVNSDVSVRTNAIKTIKGTPASSPVPPTLTNSGTLHQYPICDVYVANSVSEIIQANVTSRIGSVDTPMVALAIDIVVSSIWGQITGTLSAQTDLQAELDKKILLLPFGVYAPGGTPPLTTSPAYPYNHTILTSYTLVEWAQHCYVNTTNNASNYWRIALKTIVGGVYGTTIKEINTSGISPDVHSRLYTNTFDLSSLTTANINIVVQLDKQGTPGSIFIGGPTLKARL